MPLVLSHPVQQESRHDVCEHGGAAHELGKLLKDLLLLVLGGDMVLAEDSVDDALSGVHRCEGLNIDSGCPPKKIPVDFPHKGFGREGGLRQDQDVGSGILEQFSRALREIWQVGDGIKHEQDLLALADRDVGEWHARSIFNVLQTGIHQILTAAVDPEDAASKVLVVRVDKVEDALRWLDSGGSAQLLDVSRVARVGDQSGLELLDHLKAGEYGAVAKPDIKGCQNGRLCDVKLDVLSRELVAAPMNTG